MRSCCKCCDGVIGVRQPPARAGPELVVGIGTGACLWPTLLRPVGHLFISGGTAGTLRSVQTPPGTHVQVGTRLVAREAAVARRICRYAGELPRSSTFTAARTIVDCFRFRNKIGLDVALEALRDGWSQRKFTLDDLWRHATRGRVANVMRPYIEAITA